MRKNLCYVSVVVFVLGVLTYAYLHYTKAQRENEMLRQVITRLEADSRVAEVLVTDVAVNNETGKQQTEIKFLEYDATGEPLKPMYFRFSGNIIQFQSLVIRFDDVHVRNGDKFRGKSAYLFWKVFVLDGKNTQEYEITPIDAIPAGYKLNNENDPFEQKLWKSFWKYALDPESKKESGIKNAQIEAPGSRFVPGTLYTIRIEHDGGLRIDTTPLPGILRGERIPK